MDNLELNSSFSTNPVSDSSYFKYYKSCGGTRSESIDKGRTSDSFVGIPTANKNGIDWSLLEWEPTAVATINISLPGGLWKDSALIHETNIRHIAAPLLSKLDNLFNATSHLIGITSPVLEISPVGSKIIVLANNVQSQNEISRFAKDFECIMQDSRAEAKLIHRLAKLPGDDFSKSWFKENECPQPALLPILAASFELEAFISRYGVRLEVSGSEVDLPSAQGIKLKKISKHPVESKGLLSGLNVKPQSIYIETFGTKHILKLSVNGNGVVEEFGKKFKINDMVKVTYFPKVDLLKPFTAAHTKGILNSLETA